MAKQFLALTVDLPEGIQEEMKEVNDEFILYDSSEAEHKIPHITIVEPRKTFEIEDWKEKIQEKIQDKPTEFTINSFNSFWSSSKLGFKGELNGEADVDNPHIVLFDSEKEDDEEIKQVWSEYEPNFSKFEDEKLPIKSIAVIQKNEGIVYEEEVGESDLPFSIDQGPPFEQNEEDIEAFFNFLDHDKKTLYQVFKKDGSASKQEFIDNAEEGIELCQENKLKGLNCFGINERKKGHTKIEDGLDKINLILFDIDVDDEVKQDGVVPKKYLEEAYGVAQDVKDELHNLGLNVDYVALSGNGFHIGVKVDLNLPGYANREEWKDSITHRKLKALEEKLEACESENVEIDSITKDIIRRVKIPGTYNVKKDIPEEKYRKAKIIHINEDPDEGSNNEAFKEIGAKKEDKKSKEPTETPQIEGKENRPSFEKLLELVEEGKVDDQKLLDLYEGRNDKYTFKKEDSRSEAEASLICKLLYYGYSEGEIETIMDKCGIGKWQEEGDSYKKNTLEYAKSKEDERADWSQDYDEVESYEDKKATKISELKAEEEGKKVKTEARIQSIKESPWIKKTTYECPGCGEKITQNSQVPWRAPTQPNKCGECGRKRGFEFGGSEKEHGFIFKVTEPNKLPSQETRVTNVWVSIEDLNISNEEDKAEEVSEILKSYGSDIEIRGEFQTDIEISKGRVKETHFWIIADEIKKSEKALENIEIDEETKEKFKEKFKDMDEGELTNYVAPQIQGRDKLKKAIAYNQATPISVVEEDGETLEYGDGRLMIIGDPGEGKTKLSKYFFKTAGLEDLGGEKITAEYLSTAGLGGSVKKSKDGFWEIDWGIFPYVNGKGLILDGIHQFSKKWLSKMREMIEERKVKIIKSAKGEAECSSRIIGISNTNLAPIKDNYPTNYQASLDIGIGKEDERNKFTGADRRRWDMIWVVTSEDVADQEVRTHQLEAIANQGNGGGETRDIWRKFWAWIWSLDHSDYDWDKAKEFKDRINEIIESWKDQYPNASLPILGKKSGLLFTSYLMGSASLHYRLNDEGKISPTEEDIENVKDLFEDMFENLELEDWERKREGKGKKAEALLEAINDEIENLDDDYKDDKELQELKDIKKIIKVMGDNPTYSQEEVGEELNMSRRNVYNRLTNQEFTFHVDGNQIVDYSLTEGYKSSLFNIEPIYRKGKLTDLGKKLYRKIKIGDKNE